MAMIIYTTPIQQPDGNSRFHFEFYKSSLKSQYMIEQLLCYEVNISKYISTAALQIQLT